jgi:hypothetical protein
VRLIRNPKGINWDSFQGGLEGILNGGPEIKIKYEAGLGHAILSAQQAITSAYEKNCPLKPTMTGKHCLKWASKLECLRKEVRRLF